MAKSPPPDQSEYDEKPGWVRSVLDEYEGPLLRYAARITGDVERARDVVQETFLQLCQLESNSMNGRLAPWLYTVCRRKALDVRRKESRMQIISDEQMQSNASTEHDPAEMVERGEGSQRVQNVLTKLPQNQQEVIQLRFQSGLNYQEIAAVTNLTVSNVGYLIHTAIKAIRKEMGEPQSEPRARATGASD